MPEGPGRAGGLPSSREKYSARQMAPYVLAYVVLGAFAPRLVHFGVRLRGRRLALVTVAHATFKFAVLQWLAPWARRHAARAEAAREELAAELGREPTQIEVMERLGYETP